MSPITFYPSLYSDISLRNNLICTVELDTYIISLPIYVQVCTVELDTYNISLPIYGQVEVIRKQDLCFELDVKKSLGNYTCYNTLDTSARARLFRPYTIQSLTSNTVISR